MIELALALGRPLEEIRRLDDRELATFVSVLEERNA